MSAGDNSQAFKVEQKQPSLNEKTFKELRIPKTNQNRIYIYINELCHDSKQRRGLEIKQDIQQRNLKRRNQKLVSS